MKNKIDMDYVQRLIERFNAKYEYQLSAVQDGDKIVVSLNGQHIHCCGSVQEVNACYRTLYRVLDVVKE